MIELFASLTPGQQRKLLRETAADQLPVELFQELLLSYWPVVGRPKQQAPPGLWTYWFLRCGRGFGKTITAAQWSKEEALKDKIRFALVAPTFGDGRDTMVEGETGLLSILAPSQLRGATLSKAWNRSMGELTLSNKTKFKIFSSDEPDRVRGPQHHKAWCEEISSWRDAHRGNAVNTTWNNLTLGTRLGDNPQYVITSTPKPNKLTKYLAGLVSPQMRMVIGSSYENRANLAEAWWQAIVAPLEGTRTGQQEIEALILDDVEGALWRRAQLDDLRVEYAPDLARIVVGVDPNVTNEEPANDAGIIVAGRAPNGGHGYVLADRTPPDAGPEVWAKAAVDAYHEFEADLIVAEKNNGGDLVKMVLKAVGPNVPVKLVSAARGKRTRAEPISALYSEAVSPEGLVTREPSIHHVMGGETYEQLEDQMCTWLPGAESPDRMDALVWALTELMLIGHDGTEGSLSIPDASWGSVPRLADMTRAPTR